MSDKNGPPTSTDWWRECQSLRAELERVRSNHVTVAEEIQRRHDACAPLTAEIERLRAWLQSISNDACFCSPPCRERLATGDEVGCHVGEALLALAGKTLDRAKEC